MAEFSKTDIRTLCEDAIRAYVHYAFRGVPITRFQDEAADSVIKELTDEMRTCAACGGSGGHPDLGCPACFGSGTVDPRW